jgi:phosphoribosylformimino-5-aminoimidazole carboxamide ribotide isomerase
MMSGPNTALYARLMRQYPDIDFQASGGIAKLPDLVALKAAGVRSAISGKALYEGAIDLREALRACAATC